jgi:hypothetical protein
LRIKIFNEMAAIGDNSLDPGPELLASLCQGVPVKEAHQCPHLLDQVLDFVVRLCTDLKLRNATHKIVQKAVVR